MPKNQERATTFPGFAVPDVPGRGGAAPGESSGAPKETTPFPASGISQGEAGSAHPTALRDRDSCRKLLWIRGQLQQFQQQLSHLPRDLGESFQCLLREFSLWIRHIPRFSFLPSSFSQDAPAKLSCSILGRGFGSFFPNPGKWGSCGAAQNSALYSQGSFPGVIPGGYSRGLFPEVIPSPWLRSQLSSEDQSLATTPRSRQIFPENSPFFSLSPPHLGIPKAGSENPAGSAFKLVPKSQKTQNPETSKRKTSRKSRE